MKELVHTKALRRDDGCYPTREPWILLLPALP